MSAVEKPIEEIVKGLPPLMKNEVRDFVEFLMSKHQRSSGKKLKQNWAGALSDYKRQYSSTELQHRASEWRTFSQT